MKLVKTVSFLYTAARARASVSILTGLVLALSPAVAWAVEPGVVMKTFERGDKNQRFGAASELGAKWVRLFVDWKVVEPSPGKLDSFWTGQYDDAVNRLTGARIKPIFVVTGAPAWASGSNDGITPPKKPSDYAAFVGNVAGRYKGRVVAWEIWNEQDGGDFWKNGPEPIRYTELLKAAYPAVKAADPAATVIFGGMVANDYDFLEQAYAAGAKGSFDAVGVHTDTACLTRPPEESYRERNGRVGRFAFTGYREVRSSMLANGDDKPVWMTELGWSTSTTTCARGGSAGQKPAGVSEAEQADFLSRAFHCLQTDPFVQMAVWFNIEDTGAADTELDRYGLVRNDFSHKPSFDAFSAFAHQGDMLTAPCGAQLNATAPIVSVVAPSQGAMFFDSLPIAARATDDVGVESIEFHADSTRIIKYGRETLARLGGTPSLNWRGARNLGFGPHKIIVKAFDEQRNEGQVAIDVVRVDPRTLKPVKTGTVLSVAGAARRSATTGGRARASRTIRVSGKVSAPSVPLLKITGKVEIRLAQKRKNGFKVVKRLHRNASKPFQLGIGLGRGRWRVQAVYRGDRPFRLSRSGVSEFAVS